MSEMPRTDDEQPAVSTSIPDDPRSDLPDDIQARNEFTRTLSANGYTGVYVLDRESGQEILHGKRPELIEYLRENDPESVRAVARDVDRHKSSVSEDLTALARQGIVEYTDGPQGAKAPQLTCEHIVIEPL